MTLASLTRRSIITASLAFLTFGCSSSSSDGTTGPNTSGNSFIAKINGTAWSANPATLSVGAVHAGAGLYTLTGTSATSFQSMSFSLYNIGGPGTYALGVTPQIFGGSVSVSTTSSGWSTPLTGAAGSITISSLTATRIAGTFNYSANPQTGTSTTLAVTEGAFDLPVTTVGTAAALPDNAGSKIIATIGGTSFAAAAAGNSVSTSGAGLFLFSANNLDKTITLSLAGVSAAGTYAASATTPVRSIQVTNSANSATWGSQVTGGSGTITITSFTATRIVGTFTGTLQPLLSTATGSLVVSGSFDLGRL